jgi:3-dehydroquinate synthase
MQTITVRLGDRSYDIVIGTGLLSELGERLKRIVPSARACLISDRTVFDLYGEQAERSLEKAGYAVARYVITPGDQSKSLSVAERIYDVLYEAQIDRRSPLVALGGGVVGDLTGFVAATWLRGVPFVQVPTTMEADIDASVGGKTAVNHAKGKNLIGAFHQPRMVLMDTQTLKTLSARDVRAGLAESIKHGMICDAEFFRLHEAQANRILALDESIIEKILARNCQIKAEVVSADERESGLREILNFGHTIGHAIEVWGGYERFRHGEAVALGMMGAGFIGCQMGRFEAQDFARLERIIEKFGLPTRQDDLDSDECIELMKRDKKSRAGTIRFVLPTAIGRVASFDDVPIDIMKEAIAYLGRSLA